MRPFTDIMRDYRRGKAVEQITAALNELVISVDQTHKAGTLTIKITVKPEADGGNQKTMGIAMDLKKPMPSIPDAVFFSDAHGDLHRSDPNQQEMFTEATVLSAERGPKTA